MKTRKKKKKDRKGTIEQENLKRYKEGYDKKEGVERMDRVSKQISTKIREKERKKE